MLNLLLSVFLTFVSTPVQQDEPVLSVTFPASGVAKMDWDAFGGTGIYTVEVFELPGLNQVHYSTTAQLTTTVGSLTSSVEYRFKVTTGSDFVIMEMETP
jgi:hypothetical protein